MKKVFSIVILLLVAIFATGCGLLESQEEKFNAAVTEFLEMENYTVTIVYGIDIPFEIRRDNDTEMVTTRQEDGTIFTRHINYADETKYFDTKSFGLDNIIFDMFEEDDEGYLVLNEEGIEYLNSDSEIFDGNLESCKILIEGKRITEIVIVQTLINSATLEIRASFKDIGSTHVPITLEERFEFAVVDFLEMNNYRLSIQLDESDAEWLLTVTKDSSDLESFYQEETITPPTWLSEEFMTQSIWSNNITFDMFVENRAGALVLTSEGLEHIKNDTGINVSEYTLVVRDLRITGIEFMDEDAGVRYELFFSNFGTAGMFR